MQHGWWHGNLVCTLGVTQCDPFPLVGESMLLCNKAIAHFQVAFGFFTKVWPVHKLAIHLEISFICLWMRTVIQMKGRAPGLTLGKGLKVTQKYQKRSVNQKWICLQGTQRWPVWSSQIARFGVGYRVSWNRKNSTSFYNLIAKPLTQELSENMRVDFLITHLLFPCRLFPYLFLWGR